MYTNKQVGGIMVACPQLFGLRAEEIQRKAGVSSRTKVSNSERVG
jgi:hypothetical protein